MMPSFSKILAHSAPILLGSLLIFLSLSACRSTSDSNQSLFTPVSAEATPTLKVQPARLPDAPTPTSVVPTQVAVETYRHPSGRFSIDYPRRWQFFDRSDGAVFIEPGDRVGYSVFFSDVGQRYSDEELSQYLVTFVAQNFAEDKAFSVISPEQVVEDMVVAQFSGIDDNLGQAINEIRVSQQDTVVFIRLISATEAQWEISEQRLQALVDTFTILDSAPLTAETNAIPSTPEPVWNLVGPTSNEFGFVAPSDWDIVEQTEESVAVKIPDVDVRFEAAVIDQSDGSGYEAAEAAALDYIDEISTRYDNVRHQPPAPYPLGDAEGATIDFLFTAEDVEMAGSVITVIAEGQQYRLIFTAPAEFYEGALEWFNPMIQSFTILDPDTLIIEN